MAKKAKLTAAEHHANAKKVCDGIVLILTGDFYETFGDDADLVSRLLGLGYRVALGELVN